MWCSFDYRNFDKSSFTSPGQISVFNSVAKVDSLPTQGTCEAEIDLQGHGSSADQFHSMRVPHMRKRPELVFPWAPTVTMQSTGSSGGPTRGATDSPTAKTPHKILRRGFSDYHQELLPRLPLEQMCKQGDVRLAQLAKQSTSPTPTSPSNGLQINTPVLREATHSGAP